MEGPGFISCKMHVGHLCVKKACLKTTQLRLSRVSRHEWFRAHEDHSSCPGSHLATCYLMLPF